MSTNKVTKNYNIYSDENVENKEEKIVLANEDSKDLKDSETEIKNKKDKQQIFKKYFFVYLALVFFSIIRAMGAYVFLIPNGFAPGGVSGIATILYNAILPFNNYLAETWFNPGITVFVMNIPIFIVAFFKLDKHFVFRSLVCVILYSLSLSIFYKIGFPKFQGSNFESGIMLLGAIAGGAICGVGFGFMLRMNTSLGGSDIIGKLLYKRNPITDVQWIIFMLDCIVVISSGSLGLLHINAAMTSTEIMISVLSPILYSFIALFTSSKVADFITNGLESSFVFQIITDFPNEISEEIIKKMHRGVTILNGEGYYTHASRKIIICVVHKKQINRVKKIIKNIDQNAFVYIMNARQVTGKGFKINDVD